MIKTLISVSVVVYGVITFAQPNPDTLWTRTFGGMGWDVAYSVQQTIDLGYVIVGRTNSFGAGLNDFYLVRLDSMD